MFQEAIVNGSSYCGPTSLSCVSGIGTKEISKIIRHYFPRRTRIKGMYPKELEETLFHLDINFTKHKANCNLSAWTKYFQKPNAVYILNLTTHFLAVCNGNIVCTQFHGKIAAITDSKYLKKDVLFFYEIKSNPKNLKIPLTDSDVNKNEIKSLKKTWAKARKLCNKYNIDFELEEDTETAWAYLPDEFIHTHYQGVDPWDDAHFYYYPDDLIQNIQADVIDKISQQQSHTA